MEVEAKFVLPDVETFRRLKSLDQLASFTLSEGRAHEVRDTYVDTAGRSILAAGYACRQRRQSNGVLISLKSLIGSEGPVHRREELEVLLPSIQPPAEWPPSPVRERVLQLVGQTPLIPLFDLRQIRVARALNRDEQQVAELSLDSVRLTTNGREQAYFELEVELVSPGTEDDLAKIVRCLQQEWGLESVTLSKFERGLAFVEEIDLDEVLLTAQERAICQQIARRDDLYGRRAQAMLALDAGISQEAAGEQAGMSARRVRYWLAEFRKRRMGIFPDRVLNEAHPRPAPIPATPSAQLETEPVEAPELPPPPKLKRGKQPPKKPGLEADDSMAEAARKTLYLHYQHMVYHEPGTRLGDDIEELHDMRVATRRMRAAFRLFGDYLDMKQMSPFLKGLRRTGRALGAVRDLDVFWEKTQRYLDSLPPEQGGELEPLQRVWQAQRESTRQEMLVYLDSERYAQFKEGFGEFLKKPGNGALPLFSKKGDPIPHQLRHVVPLALLQRLADVRAYDEWVSKPGVPIERLHQLRIAAKRLRYAMEYFQEVLAPEVRKAISQVKMLQDHLGDLQDAVVASNLLRDFLTWGTWGLDISKKKVPAPIQPVVAPGVAVYLANRQKELQSLLDTFPRVWKRFQGPEFSKLVISTLEPLW